jgi:hypothetical protein
MQTMSINRGGVIGFTPIGKVQARGEAAQDADR